MESLVLHLFEMDTDPDRQALDVDPEKLFRPDRIWIPSAGCEH